MSHPAATWLEKYLQPLVGATITGVSVFEEDGDEWPRLHVLYPDGERTILEIGRDEEGNGPGFIFGLDYPE